MMFNICQLTVLISVYSFSAYSPLKKKKKKKEKHYHAGNSVTIKIDCSNTGDQIFF